MKKKLPLLLLILCLVVMAIGIYAAVRSRRSSSVSGGNEQASSRPTAGWGIAPEARPASSYFSVAIPEGTPSQIKEYEGFTVSFNKDNGTPNWVAWELLGTEADGTEGRYNKFWQDTDLEGCPETRDYSNSGYDRGHLCPAADQKWSQQAMVDCFSLANIAPQDHDLNTGAWKTLENKERVWAKRDSAIVIIAGPIYSSTDTKRIGRADVRVPGAFFKVFAAPYLNEPRGIAFVYPNMTAPGNMQQYVMTIRELEGISGYDFFSELPRSEQDRLETKASFNDWNRR